MAKFTRSALGLSMRTLDKARRVASNPTRYLSLISKVLVQQLCPFFSRTSFYLQGQMDIHPDSRWPSPALIQQTGGFYPDHANGARRIFNLEPHDNARRDMLVLLMRTVITNEVQGDFAELGVYQGLTARLLHHYAPERSLHLFDTFEGFTDRGSETEKKNTGSTIDKSLFSDTSVDRVIALVQPRREAVYTHRGFFPDSIPESLRHQRFAFVHLDADLYEPTLEGLRFFYPRMSRRGIIVVHDYNAWLGARMAVDRFFSDKEETPIPMPDKSGSAVIVKH